MNHNINRIQDAVHLRRTGDIDYREMAARIEVVLNAMDCEDTLGDIVAIIDIANVGVMIANHIDEADPLPVQMFAKAITRMAKEIER